MASKGDNLSLLCLALQQISKQEVIFWRFMAQRVFNGMLNLFISNLYRFKSSLLEQWPKACVSAARASMSNLNPTPCVRRSPLGSRALWCFLQVVRTGGGTAAGTARACGWAVRVSQCARCCLSAPTEARESSRDDLQALQYSDGTDVENWWAGFKRESLVWWHEIRTLKLRGVFF